MSALPYEAFGSAQMRLYSYRDKVIDTMSTWTHDADWLVERMFSAETIHACKMGFAFASYQHRIGNEKYNILELPSVTLSDIAYRVMLAPSNTFMVNIPQELIDYCMEIQAIRVQYAGAFKVLDWLFDKCANAPSMAAYAPWTRALFSEKWQERFLGTRTTEPEGLGSMLPVIRQAAVTMSEAFLIQKTPPETKYGFSLFFAQHEAIYCGVMVGVTGYTRNM
jgi:hypothetical protein